MSRNQVTKLIKQESAKLDPSTIINQNAVTVIDGSIIATWRAAAGVQFINTENKSKLSTAAQTPAYGDRIGKKISVRSCQLRLELNNTATLTNTSATRVFRFLAVRWMGSSIPTLDKILNDTVQPDNNDITQNCLQCTYVGRADGDQDVTYGYNVLIDQLHYITNQGMTKKFIQYTIKPSVPYTITYVDTSIAAEKGQIFYWVIADDTSFTSAAMLTKTKYST